MDVPGRSTIAAGLLSLITLGGCATSGPKHEEIKDSIPTIQPGNGRIVFYRDRSALGAAVQPEIRLNGEVVGRSIPGGFFYVDRAPGTHEVATSTETEYAATVTLGAGETRYVKTSVSMGILVGRVVPALVDPSQAIEELSSLVYMGDPSAIAGGGPPAGAPAGPAIDRSPEARRTDMNDLKDLLPPQK